MRNNVLTYLEETCKKYGEKTALVDSSGGMTFSEVREKARKISALIMERTSERGQGVFVYLPKSAMSVVSFMGALYSGNFYTPTDIRFPLEKPRSIIEQLQPAVFITDSNNKGKLSSLGVPLEKMIALDEVDFDRVEGADAADSVIDTDIAYTLFTSGSTGVPKGVSIMHRGIADYVDWLRETYNVSSEDSFLNQAPFYFDNSTLDIYLCISCGATLHIVSETYFMFPAKLLSYIQEKKITSIFWVPSALCSVADSGLLPRMNLSSLRRVLFAGEVMPTKQLNIWRREKPSVQYANLYGPTEITVDCTYYNVDRDFSDDEPLPIGKPCRNVDVLVLSDVAPDGERVAGGEGSEGGEGKEHLVTRAGEVGELCVRGSCLAAGYWNDPERTAKAFVQNPLNPHYPERIYRTGDLVHYNERGELMYDGRKDFQIKHLGYRIELGEIEAAAGALPDMQSVCCVYDKEKKEIVLFYITESTAGIDNAAALKNNTEANKDEGIAGRNDSAASGAEIRKALAKVLVNYMLPARYIKVDEFPHNANGKIDRLALQAMLKEAAAPQ